MRLYLGGIRIPLDSKAFHKPLRYLNPVLLWVCDLMSIQIADSPVELALGYYPLDLFYLQLQAVCEVGDFLPHGRRGRALAMRAAHHWDLCILLG